MIHYHSPKQSKGFVQGYDPLKPSFKGPGFYHQELAPTLDLHTHDEARVRKALASIKYPDGGKINVHVYNLPYNLPEFYNGLASHQAKYNKKNETDYARSIYAFLLLGRCTSIPYEMTDFVVSHEMGHCYQYRYMPSYGRKGEDKLWKRYMKMHGLREPRTTDRHHESNAEIFANTFRILFSPYQHEFWPHKVKHPLKVKGLKSYLANVLK